MIREVRPGDEGIPMLAFGRFLLLTAFVFLVTVLSWLIGLGILKPESGSAQLLCLIAAMLVGGLAGVGLYAGRTGLSPTGRKLAGACLHAMAAALAAVLFSGNALAGANGPIRVRWLLGGLAAAGAFLFACWEIAHYLRLHRNRRGPGTGGDSQGLPAHQAEAGPAPDRRA